jgi:hypothetical protein
LAAAEVLRLFCAGRGWRTEVAERFGLSVVRRGGLRVRVPYRSRGQLLWWQDRAVGADQVPKWLAPPRDAGRPWPYACDLYQTLDAASRSPVTLLAEGPSDAIALAHIDDHPPVIAIPGGALGRHGPARLASVLAGLNIITVFDADTAGDGYRASYGATLAAAGCRVGHLRPPDGLDLDAWRQAYGGDDQLWAAQIREALEAVEWEVRGGR